MEMRIDWWQGQSRQESVDEAIKEQPAVLRFAVGGTALETIAKRGSAWLD